MQIAHLRAMVKQESGASYERVCLLQTLALFSLDPRDSGFETIGKQNGELDVYLYFLKEALNGKFIETLRTLIPDEASESTELGRGIPSETEIELLALEAEIKCVVPVSDARLAKAAACIHEGSREIIPQ